MNGKLEPMADFFAARVEGYDEHMLENVEGCREGYQKMAELIPPNAKDLLDLGCGTGLELDAIFARRAELSVVGIDLCDAMLEKLRSKHSDKALTLIRGDYFQVDFGADRFDVAVSFETLHHFSYEKKLGLYQKLFQALRSDGVYIECDYMVETQDEEDALMAQNEALRREQGISSEDYYHFDTPFTVEKQTELLKRAGFSEIQKLFRMGGTVLLIAKK